MEFLGLLAILLLGLLVGGAIIYATSWLSFSSPEINLVLGVRNQEAFVEGVIRGILALARKKTPELRLVAMDLGSNDETPAILARLSKQCPGMAFVNGTTYLGCLTIEEVALLNCGEGAVYYLDWTAPVNHLQIVPLVKKLMDSIRTGGVMAESIVDENLVIKRIDLATTIKTGTKVLEK